MVMWERSKPTASAVGLVTQQGIDCRALFGMIANVPRDIQLMTPISYWDWAEPLCPDPAFRCKSQTAEMTRAVSFGSPDELPHLADLHSHRRLLVSSNAAEQAVPMLARHAQVD